MRDIFHYWHYQVLTIQPTNPLLIDNLPPNVVTLQLIQFKMPKVWGLYQIRDGPIAPDFPRNSDIFCNLFWKI